jgi:hypothetical protein
MEWSGVEKLSVVDAFFKPKYTREGRLHVIQSFNFTKVDLHWLFYIYNRQATKTYIRMRKFNFKGDKNDGFYSDSPDSTQKLMHRSRAPHGALRKAAARSRRRALRSTGSVGRVGRRGGSAPGSGNPDFHTLNAASYRTNPPRRIRPVPKP